MREHKIQENRVRRIAKRRGFILKRSRRRDPQALDYDRYWLLDGRTGFLAYPKYPEPAAEWGVELDDVEEWLTHYQRR